MNSGNWRWDNTTRISFGEYCVKNTMKDFVKPNSSVVCCFGGGSIMKNGAKDDVDQALKELNCKVQWLGGIEPNPEYKQLLGIIHTVRQVKPDYLLAVGGGSVVDATKYISVAAKCEDSIDLWTILTENKYPKDAYPLGVVITLPATGSEWNKFYVISRRETNQKLPGLHTLCYPKFSLVDPRYSMTLPTRQIRNGIYDAITHVIDQFLTPEECPLFDDMFISVMKELFLIAEPLLTEKDKQKIFEYHQRLIVAAMFALNEILCIKKKPCWGIHLIGHSLTSKYNIDHAATLAIVSVPFLKSQLDKRKKLLSKSAYQLFECQPHENESAADYEMRASNYFIERLDKLRRAIGMPTIVSEWEGCTIGKNDIEQLKEEIFAAQKDQIFGYDQCCTPELVEYILKQIVR